MNEEQELPVSEWGLGQFSFGEGGWVGYADEDVPDWTYARVRENEQGRLVISELYLARDRIDSATLRALPLGRIQARVNAFADYIRPRLKTASRPGVEPLGPEPRAPFQTKATVSVIPILDVPKGRKPDAFYRQVAEVYAETASLSKRPAADMAEASGVPVTAVHRWVAEARKRGFLSPAEPGRRG
jgi:hypothetical protein